VSPGRFDLRPVDVQTVVYRLPTATLLVTQVRDTCRRAVSFVIGRLHLFAPGAFNISLRPTIITNISL